jgi:hypothetical protein
VSPEGRDSEADRFFLVVLAFDVGVLFLVAGAPGVDALFVVVCDFDVDVLFFVASAFDVEFFFPVADKPLVVAGARKELRSSAAIGKSTSCQKTESLTDLG